MGGYLLKLGFVSQRSIVRITHIVIDVVTVDDIMFSI